ncbi:hypothetical protein BC831DRAFT_508893 [Entophlyctis helioformis]|nr:hypothetical protein BC831DRAFT_508893 [Entophlyctis helioformis]
MAAFTSIGSSPQSLATVTTICSPSVQLQTAIASLQRRLNALPISRPEAQQTLLHDRSGYRSSLLSLASCGAMNAASVVRSHEQFRHMLLTNPVMRHLIEPLPQSETGAFSRSQPTPSASSQTSASANDSTSNTNCHGSMHDPLAGGTNASTSDNLSASSTPSSNAPAFQFSQIVHRDWDDRKRDKLLIVRHVYIAHREALIACLLDKWSRMRSVFVRHDSVLPIAETSISLLDDNMSKFISRQILWLQYRALEQAFQISGVALPREYAISPEQQSLDVVISKGIAAANCLAGQHLTLNGAQVLALESCFAQSQICSKLEKKRLAARTSLELSQIDHWFAMRRSTAALGYMYRVEAISSATEIRPHLQPQSSGVSLDALMYGSQSQTNFLNGDMSPFPDLPPSNIPMPNPFFIPSQQLVQPQGQQPEMQLQMQMPVLAPDGQQQQQQQQQQGFFGQTSANNAASLILPHGVMSAQPQGLEGIQGLQTMSNGAAQLHMPTLHPMQIPTTLSAELEASIINWTGATGE